MPATPLSFRESNSPAPRHEHGAAPNGPTNWAPVYAANDDTRRHITAIAVVLGCVAAVTFALVKSGQLPNPEAAVGSPARVVAVNTAVGSWSALKTEARPMQHQIAADARRATEQKVATLEREVSDLKQARESAEAELARKSRELDAERTARQAAEQRATAAETRARQSAVEPSTAVERRLADATSALPEAKSPAHSASDESSPKNAAY